MINTLLLAIKGVNSTLTLFERIVFALQKTAERPSGYGWFHLLFFFLVVDVTIILCVFFRKISEKKFKTIIFIFWIVMVLFEVYKQIVYSFSVDGAVWDYQWYSFPFQFCSTPLYVLPFLIFLKDGKVKDGAILFICTFSLFAGVAVYFYPGDVFATDLLGVQIQTMVHHGSQVIIGVYTAVYYKDKINVKTFLYSLPVFSVMVLSALILNLIMHSVTTETFNMFFISPYFDCALPILGSVRGVVPYVVFLLVYVFGFALCAFIMYLLTKGGIELVKKVAEKTGNNH